MLKKIHTIKDKAQSSTNVVLERKKTRLKKKLTRLISSSENNYDGGSPLLRGKSSFIRKKTVDINNLEY